MSKVAVHDVDQFVEGTFIRERVPAVAVIEREAVVASSEGCESEALIWTELDDSAQNKVAAANVDRQAARGAARGRVLCSARGRTACVLADPVPYRPS